MLRHFTRRFFVALRSNFSRSRVVELFWMGCRRSRLFAQLPLVRWQCFQGWFFTLICRRRRRSVLSPAVLVRFAWSEEADWASHCIAMRFLRKTFAERPRSSENAQVVTVCLLLICWHSTKPSIRSACWGDCRSFLDFASSTWVELTAYSFAKANRRNFFLVRCSLARAVLSLNFASSTVPTQTCIRHYYLPAYSRAPSVDHTAKIR